MACVYYVYALFLIGCVGSVGISLASRVMYMSRVCVSACVEWRAGTISFGHYGGMGGGPVQIFPSLWLCSGGYGTAEMVKGVVSVFSCFPQFAVSSLGGWVSAVSCCVIFCDGSFVLFFRGFLFCKVLIVDNLLQVVSQESAP